MGSMPRVRSRTPWRMRRTSGLLVWTIMPSETGVWQEAGKPRRPSTCTRHVRHAPMAGIAGSLHSCGIYVPEAFIASRMELPSRASTWHPVNCEVDGHCFTTDRILLRICHRPLKSLPEVRQSRPHGARGHLSESAQGAKARPHR